jgi:hypothetical protein
MVKMTAALRFVSALALVVAASAARADCNIKDFIVKDIVSLQQSGSTQLAFVLTATQSQYEDAKKNIDTVQMFLVSFPVIFHMARPSKKLARLRRQRNLTTRVLTHQTICLKRFQEKPLTTMSHALKRTRKAPA